MGNGKVLDTSALMAYLENEPEGPRVKELLLEAVDDHPLLMSVVNWGEIYYLTLRQGKEEAEKVMQFLEGLPLEIVDVDRKLTRLAAEIKTKGGISYADCFAAALARQSHATLVTNSS